MGYRNDNTEVIKMVSAETTQETQPDNRVKSMSKEAGRRLKNRLQRKRNPKGNQGGIF